MTRGSEWDVEIRRPPAVENATRGRAAQVPRTTVRHMFCCMTKNKQNVNKNNAEYILRLHLVNVTSRDRFTVTREHTPRLYLFCFFRSIL